MKNRNNPWRRQAIDRAWSGGDIPRAEAALVAGEYDNGPDAPFDCHCGGKAWYKASIGASKCVECGDLTHNGRDWFGLMRTDLPRFVEDTVY